jgi:ferredoxin
MKVAVDAEKCVSSGQCVLLAPETFDQRDDGVVVLIDAEPSGSAAGQARGAAATCPARAIMWTE